MLRQSEASYNERLFKGGIRRYFHESRFRWLRWAVSKYCDEPRSVLELGCYDTRSLDYMPTLPTRYMGVDANWEGGLTMAKQKWRMNPAYCFHECSQPSELEVLLNGSRFDVSLCLETFEHIPPRDVTPFLQTIRQATTGRLFITVPNEKGLVFLAKYFVKGAMGDRQSFSSREVVGALLGRMDWVHREEHKGFDYVQFIEELGRSWRVLHISGYPYRWLPGYLNFGVGIVATNSADLSI